MAKVKLLLKGTRNRDSRLRCIFSLPAPLLGALILPFFSGQLLSAEFFSRTAQENFHGLQITEGFRFLFARPASMRSTDGTPLLVALHGTGDAPRTALAVWAKAAVSDGFCLLCPAPLQENWNTARDVPQILNLTRLILHQYHLDSRRIYLTGFSAGATFACILGRSERDLYSALALCSGHYLGMKDSPANLPTMPILFTHGTKDKTIGLDQARNYARHLEELGVSVRFDEIADGGHTYPDPRTTKTIADWLLRHRRKVRLPGEVLP